MSDSTTIAYSEGQAAFDEDEVGVKKEYNFDFSIWYVPSSVFCVYI
jgi:hypothetical protein